MRSMSFMLLLILAAALFSGCNLFSWSYSEEESTDIQTVLSGADVAFRDRDFSKAVALYNRALQLNPNDNYPRFRLLQSLLLRNSGDTALLTLHGDIFSTDGTGALPLYASYSNTKAFDFLTDSGEAYQLLPYRDPAQGGFWSALSPDNSAVLNDSGTACAVYGFILLQDGNGNGAPFESSDPGILLDNFLYDAPAGLTQEGKTNLSQVLAQSTNALHRAAAFLDSKTDLSGVWLDLRTNLNTAITNLDSAISNLGVL